jgi:two-component system NtrC family sensor kinase
MTRVLAGESQGVLTLASPGDGHRRLTAFREVEGHGLYVSSSIDHDAILAAWYGELARLALFTFPTALGLAWMSWVALRHTRHERTVIDHWQAETVKRAQAEDALRQTQRLEALGHLTGGVAHDVNNLLMVVSNNAHLIRRLPPGHDASGPLNAIQRAVTTGARVTRQLLAFSNRQAVRPEVIDLNERLPLLKDLMRHSASSAVAIEAEVAPDTRCIKVDPAELELAMINLAVNARDAMPEGGSMRLTISNAEPVDGTIQQVRITVSDTGSGIAAEHIGRVFEPFYTTKAPGKGTGLGLSQVYGFCQQAGGSVSIRSQPGAGATVELLLPAMVAAPDPSAGGLGVAPAHGRVLLVEDNAEVAEATAPLLADWGYIVNRAASADTAREMIEQSSGDFDLLLSDIVMPGKLDGLALARWVRQAYPAIGIVLMTGHASQTAKAMSEGLLLLQKPWMPEALAAALIEARQPS